LTCKGENAREIADKLNELEEKIRARLGHLVFGRDDEKLEAVVGRLLRERKATLAVAESCTGGLVASRLTDVPGSSDYFERGVVAYNLEAKERLLNVPASLLERHGAVSLEVARAMAAAVRGLSGTALGLATTGIAGPSAGEPISLICVPAWDSGGGRVSSAGDRSSEIPQRAEAGNASPSPSRHTHGRSLSAGQGGMRLFVAVHLSQEIRDGLASLQDRLRRAQADVSWVKPANLHITLKFLGETEPKRLESIGSELTEAARSAAPFSLAVAGGYVRWPHPRVVWAGGGGGAPAEALPACRKLARLGFPKERRRFWPISPWGGFGLRDARSCGRDPHEPTAAGDRLREGFVLAQASSTRGRFTLH
jgi:PncC family amidohydrolase